MGSASRRRDRAARRGRRSRPDRGRHPVRRGGPAPRLRRRRRPITRAAEGRRGMKMRARSSRGLDLHGPGHRTSVRPRATRRPGSAQGICSPARCDGLGALVASRVPGHRLDEAVRSSASSRVFRVVRTVAVRGVRSRAISPKPSPSVWLRLNTPSSMSSTSPGRSDRSGHRGLPG